MRFLPIALFIFFLALAGSYFLNDGKLARSFTQNSKLIDKPLPKIKGLELPLGKPAMINLFASWCVACLAEHGIIMNAKNENPNITLIGLNWRDKTEAMEAWLRRYGNPYDIIVEDKEGASAVALGVKGIPETYIVNDKGIVVYKHLGPMDGETLKYVLSQVN